MYTYRDITKIDEVQTTPVARYSPGKRPQESSQIESTPKRLFVIIIFTNIIYNYIVYITVLFIILIIPISLYKITKQEGAWKYSGVSCVSQRNKEPTLST